MKKLDVDQEYIEYLREKCHKIRFNRKVPKRKTPSFITLLISFITFS